MKKAKDEMRPEYKRSDFTELVRGKYYKEIIAGSNIVLLEPAIAKAFPTSKAVNEALAGLLASTAEKPRATRRPVRTRAKAARTS
jgi:hypothetical protein